MTDIVERLRQVNPWMSFSAPDPERVEAAAEIEALREQVDALRLVATANEPEALRLQTEIERLRETVKEQMREVAALRAALQAIAIQALATHPPHEYARRALEPKP